MISPGPRGQSKETTGRPLLIASTRTMPKPSKREDSANTDALGERLAEVAGRAHEEDVVAQAGSTIRRCSAARCGPRP